MLYLCWVFRVVVFCTNAVLHCSSLNLNKAPDRQGLEFRELLEETSEKIKSQKTAANEAVKKLAASFQKERPWAVLSNSGSLIEMDSADEEDKEAAESAERALEELGEHLPLDVLFRLLRHKPETTVGWALQSVKCTLKKSLQEVLKRARRAQDKAWVPTDCLGSQTLQALHSLKVLCSLAQSAMRTLSGLTDIPFHNVPDDLGEKVSDANSFIDELLKSEPTEWRNATTKTKGWQEQFSRHFKMMSKLDKRELATQEMRDAAKMLYQKTSSWHQQHLAEANEAILKVNGAEGIDGAWQSFLKHAVQEGLAFEQSSLYEQLSSFKPQFRPLVEKQAGKLREENVHSYTDTSTSVNSSSFENI